MKIAVWRTGHEIADRVAEAVYEGLRLYATKIWPNLKIEVDLGSFMSFEEDISEFDIHIGYGILRGMGNVFKACQAAGKPFIHIDKGYWKPGHFDGYYRVSLNGTQQTTGLDKLEPDYAMWDALGIEVLPARDTPPNNLALICPPTDYVSAFYGVSFISWTSYQTFLWGNPDYKIRTKDSNDQLQEDLNKSRNVITFNSSVGWEALRQGIPVVSDATHSIVGAYQKLIDKPLHMDYDARRKFFAVMSGLQLTLSEIKSGLLWPLIQRLIST